MFVSRAARSEPAAAQVFEFGWSTTLRRPHHHRRGRNCKKPLLFSQQISLIKFEIAKTKKKSPLWPFLCMCERFVRYGGYIRLRRNIQQDFVLSSYCCPVRWFESSSFQRHQNIYLYNVQGDSRILNVFFLTLF